MEKVYSDQVMLESLRIRAFRDVGVAFGENHKLTYVYDIMVIQVIIYFLRQII